MKHLISRRNFLKAAGVTTAAAAMAVGAPVQFAEFKHLRLKPPNLFQIAVPEGAVERGEQFRAQIVSAVHAAVAAHAD